MHANYETNVVNIQLSADLQFSLVIFQRFVKGFFHVPFYSLQISLQKGIKRVQ